MSPLQRPAGSPRSWFVQMQQAYAQARFSDAAECYDRQPGAASLPQAVLLRVRIFFKKNQYPAAIALLSTRAVGGKEHEAERLMLLAIAHSRTNRFDEADELFARADRASASKRFPVEFLYARGRRFLDERKPRQARSYLEKLRSFTTTDARISGDLLEMGILSQEERYHDEARLLRDLFRFMDKGGRSPIEESIHALETLAVLARELDDPEVRDFAARRVNLQTWTDDFRTNQFQTLKAIGWCHALQGDYFNGLRYIKMAGSIAPTTAWRAITNLDRAYLARCFDETRWSTDELWEADELLQSVNWRDTNDEERVALLLAAELYAPLDSGKAAAYVARFSELRDTLNPLLLFRYDRRLQALADYAAGVVNMQFGNRRAALVSLQKAWNVYDKIQYDWRAGRAALRLYELTKNSMWLSRAEKKLRSYERSWLAEELRNAKPALDDAPRLTKTQLRVLRMIYEGKNTEQISIEMGRSPNTVQNHVKAINKAFGVRRRTALLAEIIKRGINLADKGA